LRAQAERYPFVSALEPLSALLEPLRGRSAGWYLTELSQQSDAIADAREDHYSPIKRFLDGPQRAIYDDARDYLARQRPNLHQVDPALVTPIETTLADPACFKGQAMQQLKTQLDALKTEIREQLAAERARAEQEILHMRAQLEGLPEYAAQSDSLRAEIDSAARAAIKRLAHEDHLAVIRDTLHNFRDHTYPELLARLTAPLVSEQPPATEGNPQPHSAPATQPAKPPQQLVPLRNLSVPFGQPLLRTPEDVDAYLSALRQRLLDTLEAGQGISL
ncbi:MAG: hypothetical protein JXM75_00585, partial [Chromatiaceae bacterium]|nr:hypothetical protein [Chromatiaceae bacterium]